MYGRRRNAGGLDQIGAAIPRAVMAGLRDIAGTWSEKVIPHRERPAKAEECRDLTFQICLMDGRHLLHGTDPGTITLTPPGIEAVWEAGGSSRAAVIAVRPEFLSRAIEENWDVDSKNVEILKQFLIHDPVIDAVTLNLAREAASRSPAGRLYAESACEFLAHHLIHHYSTLAATPPRPIGGLPGRRLKLVLDYIEDTLGRPIELRSLAALAGISARHFERAFRQSIWECCRTPTCWGGAWMLPVTC